MTHGVVYIAYGTPAMREATYSIETLKKVHPDWPVVVIGDRRIQCDRFIMFEDDTGGTPGRNAKTNLNNLTPFQQTLFLDADTRVFGSLSVGFDALTAGWDLVIVPSQGSEFAHLDSDEREATFFELGENLVQLNTGVMWFKKSHRVDRLFSFWRTEWQRWKDKDQGALLRALHRCSLKIWLMGRPFNGGQVVQHRFGACRRT
jgi:hypothetical protein